MREHQTHLSWIWEYGARGHECWCIGTEFWDTCTSPSRLVNLDGYVLTLDIRTMHGLFPHSRIFFSPELYHTCIETKAGLDARRGKRTVRPEKVVELRVGKAWWEVLDETWDS